MGALSSAQLFASCCGVVSPLHYDTLHNLFCQMSGAKVFLLWPPRATAALKPYPVCHPLDRRSQLDLREQVHPCISVCLCFFACMCVSVPLSLLDLIHRCLRLHSLGSTTRRWAGSKSDWLPATFCTRSQDNALISIHVDIYISIFSTTPSFT